MKEEENSSIEAQTGLFDSIFLHQDSNACPAKDYYTYNSFIQASRTGSSIKRKREIAASLAQISHETTGGWPSYRTRWTICMGFVLQERRITIMDQQVPRIDPKKLYILEKA
ncbi:hypothetical protein SADUNF_Sadunf02G0156400 [Salix dunnii]|uniref:Glycoside hydrolase family 19 catalytic domain-containing protein n=1 Tax=Salix dunnii TaxID=1413687 RepID=A0A835N8H6_9ROSI|nr:hypothetical protein SADUNF_Sadunf02G0156400 [Salix dunnii]